MSKVQRPPFSWLVMDEDISQRTICTYDVLEYIESDIKKMKKKYPSLEGFAEALRKEMSWRYWSKSEHELIISIDDQGRVTLCSWLGGDRDNTPSIIVKDELGFDWAGFAQKHISAQRFKDRAKIDVYDQLQYRWDEFVDFCWNYHHKWQRNRKENKL